MFEKFIQIPEHFLLTCGVLIDALKHHSPERFLPFRCQVGRGSPRSKATHQRDLFHSGLRHGASGSADPIIQVFNEFSCFFSGEDEGWLSVALERDATSFATAPHDHVPVSSVFDTDLHPFLTFHFLMLRI